MSCVARADLDRYIYLYHVPEQVSSYTDAVYMLYLSIASAIGKCADMPLNAFGSADCADTGQPGSQFADPSDRQEFNALSCVIQGKQETEASPLTPSWL